MRSLSERASVSVPTIYNLVGGRDDVLLTLLEAGGAVFDASVAVMPDDPIDRCFAAVDHVLEVVGANATIVRSVIRTGLGPTVADLDGSMMQRLWPVLLTSIQEADDTDRLNATLDAELLVDHIRALTAAQVLTWALADPALDPDGVRLRLTVTHGVGVILLAAAEGATAEIVRVRIDEAAHQLRNPTPVRPTPA